MSWGAAAQTRHALCPAWGATTRRAIPCVGAAWGRPGGWFPTRGRSPSGGCLPGKGAAPAAGARSISFSEEKETGLDSKEKRGPVFGAFVLRKRRPASLRTVWGPAPAVTAMPLRNRDRLWFYLVAAWMSHSHGRVRRQIVTPHERGTMSRSPCAPQKDHPTTPALREEPAGGGWLGPPAFSCSTRAGRNGREGSSLSYESRMPPSSTTNPP